MPQLPERLGVDLVRHAVRLVAGDDVPAALDGLEPGHIGTLVRVWRVHSVEKSASHTGKIAALLGAVDLEAVWLEPALRSAVDNPAGGHLVDAPIVPVDEIVEVVQAQAEGGVLRLVARPSGEAAFAFDREDLDALGAGALQGHRLTGRGGRPVAGWSGVELQKERLAFHLRMASQALVAAEAKQVSPDQLPFFGLRHQVPRVLSTRVLRL